MAQFIYPPQQVSITGVATEATLLQVEQNTADTVTELQGIAAAVDALNVVDQLDTPLFDASSTNIPASSSLPIEVVASTAAAVRKIISVEDIGEYIGLYTGPASSEVLKCVLPLGGGEVELEIAAGTRLSLRHMKNTAITLGNFAMNLLG